MSDGFEKSRKSNGKVVVRPLFEPSPRRAMVLFATASIIYCRILFVWFVWFVVKIRLIGRVGHETSFPSEVGP